MFKKNLSKSNLKLERKKILVLLFLIILTTLTVAINVLLDQANLSKKTAMGVSFSPQYARALGLDAGQVYQATLKDLRVKNIRLNAYWDEIEQSPDEYDFADLDYYINEAAKNNADIILTIGYKLPRWPECRVPKWLKGAPIALRQERQLKMLNMVIDYYTIFNPNPHLKAFQVENEPLLDFGTCDPVDKEFLKKEIAFVRSKTNLPILLTDSGELSAWTMPMTLGDYFGTTLYRVVHNEWIGAFPYPLQPWFYRTKAFLVKNLFARNNQQIMLVELQTEPWAHIFIADIPISEQINQFKIKDFQNNVNFAKKVGFSANYLWGVEWWYWMKTKGYPEYWSFAKTLFN